MADDRLIQRYEEQLRDAHATNAELREREATKLRGEDEELRASVDRLECEADALNELNARIGTARHVHDLLPKQS
jgi:predicted nuclease with TOPRIM domain